MLIEQAIFTSIESDRSAGYHLVAQSPNVSEADARSLSSWGPSHDSLIDICDDAASVNFHALPSGAYCVSKTTHAGGEYSGRAGQRVHTQCLIVPAEVLARFANNPFSLLTAAQAQGALHVSNQFDVPLAPFQLGGKSAAVDHGLLSHLLVEPGRAWLAALAQAAVDTPRLAIAAAERSRLIAGIFSCLPVEWRPRYSFSTGLKPSPKRPYRLLGAAADAAELRQLTRNEGVAVLELGREPPSRFVSDRGWGGFISAATANGKTRWLAGQLSDTRREPPIDDLNTFGDQLLSTLEPRDGESLNHPAAYEGHPFLEALSADRLTSMSHSPLRADGAHAATVPISNAAATESSGGQTSSRPSLVELAQDGLLDDPSQVLGWQSPETVEKLEVLDDAVFEAIAGKRGAIETLRRLWPELLLELPVELAQESRAQYIRHAMRVWKECLAGEEIHNPAHAIAAMEVITLLFDE